MLTHIKLVSLSIDNDVNDSGQSLETSLVSDAFDTVDSQQLHSASQLPALGERDCRANSVVRTGPKPYGYAIDLFPFELRAAQRLFNHSDGFGRPSARFDDFAHGWCGMRRVVGGLGLHDRDTALRRRKLKRQYLHK